MKLLSLEVDQKVGLQDWLSQVALVLSLPFPWLSLALSAGGEMGQVYTLTWQCTVRRTFPRSTQQFILILLAYSE